MTTQSVFTVRSSRSYFKKPHKPEAAETCGNNDVGGVREGMDLDFVGRDGGACSSGEDLVLPPSSCDSSGSSLRGFEQSTQVMTEDSDDSSGGVVGPLRWEYVLGKPPIPFTGTPFYNIGM